MRPLRIAFFVLVLGAASGAWAQDPSGLEALSQGKAAAGRGDFAAALTLFERAAATLESGQKGDAYLWAALAAEKLDRRDEAERYKSLALAPEPPPVVAEPVQAKPASAGESLNPPDTLPVEHPPVAAPATEARKPETPKETPDAFQHFFGRKEAKAPAKEEEKEEVKARPEVDAFQYFFGRREKKEDKKEKEGEASESEKPPA